MKKYFYTLIISPILFLNSTLFAQVGYHSVQGISTSSFSQQNFNSRVLIDTLFPSSLDTLFVGLCGDSSKIYQLNSPEEGYIGGNNSHGDLEVMQKYGINGTGGVLSIVTKPGKMIGTANGSFTAKLYAVNPVTHGPDSVIYVADPTTHGTIAYDILHGLYAAFEFPGQIFVSDSFFAAIELPTTQGDTFAVYVTPQNCYSGKQQAYVKKSDGSFSAIGDAGSYGLNADFFIGVAFVPDSISFNSSISYNDLTLFRAYPNPSSVMVNVNFSVKNSTQVSVEFINELGQLIRTEELGYQSQGKHSVNIDVNSIPAGNYYYSIVTPHERLFSKICVLHK